MFRDVRWFSCRLVGWYSRGHFCRYRRSSSWFFFRDLVRCFELEGSRDELVS